MANCSSCNGSCGGGTRVGALNSLCRTGCRFPYYTGPCPPAPCVDKCGNTCSACRCGCANARVIDLNSCDPCGCNACSNNCGTCGCNNCNGCGGPNTCGCNNCNNCGNCNNCDNCGCDNCESCSCDDCGSAWNCSNCGCSNCGSSCCSNCGTTCCSDCGWNRTGCNSLWNHSNCECNSSWNHGCSHAGHALFSVGGPISLSAGGSVELEARNVDARYFTTSYGSILIRRPGLYYAAVTVDIPKHTDVDTVIRLELDNHNITPPEIAVTTNCDDTTANFAGHTIFHAGVGSLLKLCSLREMTIDCGTAQPVFTVTLFRIS